jgi:hypothetical protein
LLRKQEKQNDMTKASIHVCPAKGGSEEHNLREKELNYVKPDLSHLNQSEVNCSIKDRFDEIKAKYEVSTGQKMQSKSTPIREGVVNLADHVTMEDLKKLSSEMEKTFGIRTFQIHIHEDEGHNDKATGEWKQNRHAHMVMDWTDKETGKSLKLDRHKMAEMQTLVADVLQMERGKSSDVKHLSSLEYKAKMKGEELQELLNEIEKIKLDTDVIKKENREKINSSLVKGLSNLVGMDSDKARIKELSQNNEKLGVAYESVKDTYEETKLKLDETTQKAESIQRSYADQLMENKRLELQIQNLRANIKAQEEYSAKQKELLEEKTKQMRELKTAVHIVHFQTNPNPELKLKAESYLSNVNKEFVRRETNPLIEKPSINNDKGKGLSI